MKNSRMVKVLLAAALLPGCALLNCMNPNSGGTETGDAKVSGVLYNSGGSRSAGAKVACIPRHYNPNGGSRTGIDSTVTDDTGSYRFKTMPADTYNIFAQSDSGLVYIESVVVKPDSQRRIPPDTLKAPGSIRGRIELEPGDDARNVFIIFLGTYVFRMADDSVGNFAISDLAKGRYRVRILANLPNYRVMDTAFTITAGRDSVLPQPIRLEYTGIPVPQGLRIVYDTLKQIVTLIWNKPTTGRPIQGYNIYRKHQDSSLVILKSDWSDTTYNDSTGIQDITYEYRVAAVDTNTTEGTRSAAVSVIFSSSFNLFRTLGNGQGTGNGQFNGLRSLAVDSGGNIFCVDEGNNRIQVFDSIGNYLRQWGSQFGTPEDICIDSVGNIYVADYGNHRIQKFSNGGAFVSQWGSYGSANGEFNFPDAIAIWGDALFIGEWSGQRVQKFGLDGNFVLSFGVGGPVSGLAVIDSVVFVAVDSMILRYNVQGLLIDTLCMPPVMADIGSRPSIRSLYAKNSTVYYSAVVSGGEDAVWGISLAGETILKYLCILESGTPQDIFVSNQIIFISFHDGYVREYRIK
jgi:hypothetical protein